MLALAFVLIGLSCLPELDPARLAVLCRGGSPDGFLDPEEQCDDGNTVGGDGCDPACQLECEAPAVLDESTRHCYLPISGLSSADEAAASCRNLGAALVTVRSAAEQDFLARTLLAAATGPFLTAYRLDEGSVATAADSIEVHEAIPYPSILYAEPGFLSVEHGSPAACPGCFSPGLAEGWWAASSSPTRRIGLGPGANFTVFEPHGPLSAICERTPAGAPPNPCPSGPSCASKAATSQIQLQGRVYSFFATPSSREDALGQCIAIGAQLWLMQDEAERELVVRSLGLISTGSRTLWVGLQHGAAGWASTGTAPLPSPLPWALEPTDAEAAASPCAVLLTRSTSYALGLLLPAACVVPPGEVGSAFVCVGP